MFDGSVVPMGFSESSDDVLPSNYPVEADHEFTPDEIQLIEAFKADLNDKIKANKAFAKGIEMGSINVISYCCAKMIVFQLGGAALPYVILASSISNLVINRDCFDFKIDRDDGEWRLTGMQKLVRFGLGLVLVGFQAYSLIGDIIIEEHKSKLVYSALEESALEYSRLIEADDKTGAGSLVLTILGVGLVAGLGLGLSSRN